MSAPPAHDRCAPTDAARTGFDTPREVGPPAPPVPAPVGEARRSGYEHLAAVFAERAGLPDGHPRREELRVRLIREYLPVARHIARKHDYRRENPDDMEQVARLGLILAVDRFDPGRGVNFLSYAVPTISGEVLRYLRDRSTPIRMPRRLRDVQRQVDATAAELAQSLGRAARPSEIAGALGLDLDDVLEALAAHNAGYTASLDQPARDDDGAVGDRNRLDAALGRVEPEFDLVEHREALAPLLAALPARERRILLMRFFGGMTQTEIGQQIGISQMHVSRLLTRTLGRLHHTLTADH